MFDIAKPEQKDKAERDVRNKQEKNSTPANLTGIPENIKTRFENLSGFSFDDVRVHYNSDKPAQLQALAYTQGNQVHVAPGQEKYLGHELGHVVQQKEGRVRPTVQMHGVNINDSNALETEADSMGIAMTRGEVTAYSNTALQMVKAAPGVVQRGKDIAPVVYYGHGLARAERMQDDGVLADGDTHTTIDTLNKAIGFDPSISRPPGMLRHTVKSILDKDARPEWSNDENEWHNWLRLPSRRTALLMEDVDEKTFLNDFRFKMESKNKKKTIDTSKARSKPKRISLATYDDGVVEFWDEEDYSVNVPRDVSSFKYKAKKDEVEVPYTNKKFFEEYMRSEDSSDVLAAGKILDAPLLNAIETWISSVLMTRFWRFTSLMGMDFFAYRNKRIKFVRDEFQKEYYAPDRGRAITDSEWSHAEEMRRDMMYTVERIDPRPREQEPAEETLSF